MNKNENKKSARLWPQKLFKHSGSAGLTTQGKTYFGHRYHHQQVALEAVPFGAFFSDASVNHASTHPVGADFKAIFSHELTNLKIQQQNLETSSDAGVGKLLATENRFNIADNLGNIEVTVLNCYHETWDTKTFRLGATTGKGFAYLPGQYITLAVIIAGKEYKRSYSIASSPTNSGIVEITVKRSPNGGVVSNWLIDCLKIGDTLKIKGPYGKFSCVPHMPHKILLLAAGSGVVPVMSMLRWLANTEARTDVTLILSFRTVYDIIYRDELNLIAARHPNIKLVITLTQEPVSYGQWQGLTGHVCQEMLAVIVPDLPDRAVYLCGPDTFMADCTQSLRNLNLPREQLYCESFSVNTTPETPRLASTCNQVSREQTGNYQIRFAKSGKAIASDGAMSLLELAELSGIRIGNECRAGNCGECMVKCLEGHIEMTEQAEIDDFDRKKGWIYSCCAYPASDVALDI